MLFICFNLICQRSHTGIVVPLSCLIPPSFSSSSSSSFRQPAISRRVPSTPAWSCSRSLLVERRFIRGFFFLGCFFFFFSCCKLYRLETPCLWGSPAPGEGRSLGLAGSGIATSCIDLLFVSRPCARVRRALFGHRFSLFPALGSLLPSSLGDSYLIVIHVIIRPGGNSPSSHPPAKNEQRHKREGRVEKATTGGARNDV